MGALAHYGLPMQSVELILLILLLASLTGVVGRYLPAVPLPLIQIAMGVALAWPNRGVHVRLDPEIFLLLFVPPLLFADGARIPKRELFALMRPILTAALGLVFFTVVGLGYLVHWMLPEMPLSVAFALAAVLAPTDAVAVSAITRGLGMPARTGHVLDGESMLNDASGLVALKFAVAATVTGAFSWSAATREFLWAALGGGALGAAMGWGFAWLRDAMTRRLGDVVSMQMALLLILLPFATYMVGEWMGTSGILAAVAAGITVNVTDLQRQDFVAERISTQRLWALVETVFNGTIFLLLGLQLPQIVGEPLIAAGSDWWRPLAQALVITLALLALRWIWLRVGVHGQIWRAHVRGQSSPPTSMRETLAATLAGIRGAITLAGALSVPLLLNDGSLFPQRQTLIFLATCCILYTLAIGSVSLPIVLRGLPQPAEDPLAREERQARIVECRAALAELAQAPGEVPATETARLLRVQDAAGRIAEDYRKRLQLLEGPAQSSEEPEVQAESPRALAERHLNLVAEMEIRLNVLRAERNALYGERRANRINDESLRRLGGELDLQEVALRQRLRTARQVAEANQATGDAAP